MVLPLEDKYSVTRNELQDQLTYAMGGRVAEEIVFPRPTTGASGNDIEKATGIAARWSPSTARPPMSDPSSSARRPARSSWGRDMGHGRDFSERIAERASTSRCAISSSSPQRGLRGDQRHRDILDSLPLALLEKETLDHHELAEIFRDVKKLPPAPQWPPSIPPRLDAAAGGRAPSSGRGGAGCGIRRGGAARRRSPRRSGVPSGQARPATA